MDPSIPSTSKGTPKDSSTDSVPEKTQKQTRSKSKSKEDVILEHLSSLSARIAESDAVLRKLSALPEALAFQANNNEQLTTRVTELSERYDESFDMHNVDLEEVADSEGDSLNPTKMTPPSFASLLNITSADVKDKAEVTDLGSDTSEENRAKEEVLNILRTKNKAPSTYGQPLEDEVAGIIKGILEEPLEKKLLERLKSDYKTPENCKLLCTPRVNPELWANFNGYTMNKDFEFRGFQDAISTNIIVLARMAELMSKNLGSLREAFSSAAMNLLSDATASSAYAFQDINVRRRAQIKKNLPRDVSIACGNDMKTTDLLFGDNFAETLKSAKSAVSLTKSFNVRGRGNNRQVPYVKNGRGRGFAHQKNGDYDDRLNGNRPPHPGRGRGGRGRGNFHHNNQFQFNSQQH